MKIDEGVNGKIHAKLRQMLNSKAKMNLFLTCIIWKILKEILFREKLKHRILCIVVYCMYLESSTTTDTVKYIKVDYLSFCLVYQTQYVMLRYNQERQRKDTISDRITCHSWHSLSMQWSS